MTSFHPSTFRPLHDRMVVERLPEAAQSALLISPTPSFRGRVICTGPGRRHGKTGERIPMVARRGDIVWFGKWTDNARVGIREDSRLVLIQEGDIRFVETAVRKGKTRPGKNPAAIQKEKQHHA